MAATIYLLNQTPRPYCVMESGETVTVQVFNKATKAVVPLNTNSAVEMVGSGQYVYDMDMVTPPTFGKNSYSCVFTGAGLDQKRYFEFDWVDDESVFTDDAIHIDTAGGGTAGTVWPTGSFFQPVDNIADARTIADRYGFTTYIIKGNLTLPATAHTNWRFLARPENPLLSTITFNNCSITNSYFEYFSLVGQQNGPILATCCRIGTVTNYEGHYKDCGLYGNITQKSGGSATFIDFTPEVAILSTINVNGVSGTNIANLNGAVSLAGQTGGTTNISFTGFILVQASNVAGSFRVGGVGYWVDLGSGLFIEADATVPAAIWDRLLSRHTDPLTFGGAVNQIGTPVALDGGAATLGGMLTKIADDNAGADFDAATDSLHEMALEQAAAPADIDAQLTSTHGAGSWESATAVDWTAAERAQIRDALGVNGTKSTSTGGKLQTILSDTDFLQKLMEGDWEITGNQMIFYDTDGITPLRTYNLFNKAGLPSDVDTYKREKI